VCGVCVCACCMHVSKCIYIGASDYTYYGEDVDTKFPRALVGGGGGGE